MAKVSDKKDVVFYLGNESPRIARSLSSVAGDAELPSSTTYRLLVRERESATIVLDKPMLVDSVHDEVYYNPVSGDFDEQGYYRAWVRIRVGGSATITQDVAEFNLVVFDHAPGLGVRTGAVARWARRRAPIAWDALREYREYGDPGLQDIVELTKLRSLPPGMHVGAGQEEALDLRVLNWLALKVVVQILRVAIEYWTGQYASQTAVGSGSEVHTFPDRIAAAEKLIGIYERDIPEAQAEAEVVLGTSLGAKNGLAMLDGGEPMTPGLTNTVPEQIGYSSSYPGWCE